MRNRERIERCIRQIRVYYALKSELDFEKDFLRQDAIYTNLQRATAQCIELANQTICKYKLGLPKSSSDSFMLLQRADIIPSDLGDKLKKMIGFRNIMLHEYISAEPAVMIDVIENHLDDFLDFAKLVSEYNLQADN